MLTQWYAYYRKNDGCLLLITTEREVYHASPDVGVIELDYRPDALHWDHHHCRFIRRRDAVWHGYYSIISGRLLAYTIGYCIPIKGLPNIGEVRCDRFPEIDRWNAATRRFEDGCEPVIRITRRA